ncbi:MAG: hypothetical protein ACHREM_00885 [Polyangiales bacterium]
MTTDTTSIPDRLPCKRCDAKGARRFKTSAPCDYRDGPDAILRRRVYFVWRIARFHGGADVTMPITAQTMIQGDPYVDVLEALATIVAKVQFGTDRAAAHRWAPLLGGGGSHVAPPGLPASAYPCGPVADLFKPDFEAAEIL